MNSMASHVVEAEDKVPGPSVFEAEVVLFGIGYRRTVDGSKRIGSRCISRSSNCGIKYPGRKWVSYGVCRSEAIDRRGIVCVDRVTGVGRRIDTLLVRNEEESISAAEYQVGVSLKGKSNARSKGVDWMPERGVVSRDAGKVSRTGEGQTCLCGERVRPGRVES